MAEQTESNWTESRFRQRLVGASVVVALAVLLLPLWLDGSGIDSLRVQSVPDKPEVEGAERIEIPQPPGDSGEPLSDPPQSLFPDQTPIEARSAAEDDTAPAASVDEDAGPATHEPTAKPSGDADMEAPVAPESADEEQRVNESETAPAAEESAAAEGTVENEPAEADAALPESASDGEFVVQLGSFSDERNARALAASVESSGFDVFVTPLFSEQGTVWRVRVGPYATREQAGEATDRLRQRIGRDGLVMTK
ncbi:MULTISPECIES: SPOR domain-containing protein [unclassified Guyparkeria]|uniref:SPOR domain-containing protein n=1 Tax=unclassified Guyparkeria TaxID=2626246 RepID=UPI0007339ACE|nr:MULTISPECIES: SPOR domain-containing protein [unclassified Guyparkeria]KTG15983.1 hypothetical protein AUR63_05915 [Guyparkeria sp. XI15]OAE84738.1 hypothetical protein AWR35_05925 [Guyparkeria sp. WRN-7]